MGYAPCYSHGGSGAPGRSAVPGTATGAGLPISVLNAIQSCAMYIKVTGGTATVKVECNGTAIDSTGNPNSAGWMDISDGGLVFTAGDVFYKLIPATKAPFWRTNITAISGATVESGISQIIVAGPNGPMAARARYPTAGDRDRTTD